MLNFENALVICRNRYGETHTETAAVYNWLGLIYGRVGFYQKQKTHLDRALRIRLQLLGEQHLDVADTYHNIAFYYRNLGDYDNHLLYAQKALAIKRTLLPEVHDHIASSYNSIGVALMKKGLPEQAIPYFHKVINIKLQTKGKIALKIGTACHHLAACHGMLGSYGEERKYAFRSLDVFSQLFGESHYKVARSYIFLGHHYQRTGNPDSALICHEKALKIRKEVRGDNHSEIAESQLAISEILLQKGETKNALQYAHDALMTLVPDFNNTNIFDTPSVAGIRSTNPKVTLLSAFRQKGKVLEALQQKGEEVIKAAFKNYHCAVATIDMVRNQLITDESVLQMNSKAADLYNGAVKYALLLAEASEDTSLLQRAFEFSEKNKAYLLNESLISQQALDKYIPDSLRVAEADLVRQISWYEAIGSREQLADEKQQLTVRSRLFGLRQSYASLVSMFEKEYPRYHELKHGRKTISVAEVQAVLNKKEAFVEYFEGEKAYYVFVITHNRFSVQSIQRTEELENWIGVYSNLLQKEPVTNVKASWRAYTEAASRLYQQLFLPVVSTLNDDVSKYIIVPDGKLVGIPFEALLSKLPDREDFSYKSLHYLINDVSLAYSHSGLFLQKISVNRKPYEKEDRSCLAFAPAYTLSERTGGDSLTQRNEALVALPGTVEEVKSLGQYFGNYKCYQGKQASEYNFKQEAGKYDVIHLAMHGQADYDNPLYGRLSFCQRTADSLEDNTLYTYELMGMDINASLVVLSACETGAGKRIDGEGILSLSRGFFQAGSRSVLLSLWNADDLSNSTIVQHFYRQLAAGADKDAGLRSAKRNYLAVALSERRSHPYYWAGFVLTGSTESIVTMNHRNSQIAYPLLIGMLMIIGLLVSFGGGILKRLRKNHISF